MRYRFHDASLPLCRCSHDRKQVSTLADMNRNHREFWSGRNQQPTRDAQPPRSLAEMNRVNRAFWSQQR